MGTEHGVRRLTDAFFTRNTTNQQPPLAPAKNIAFSQSLFNNHTRCGGMMLIILIS